MRGFLCVNGQACEIGYGALRCFFLFFSPLSQSLSVSTAPPPPFRNIDATKKYWNKRNNFLEALLKLHLDGERKLVVNLPGWKRRGEGVTGGRLTARGDAVDHSERHADYRVSAIKTVSGVISTFAV